MTHACWYRVTKSSTDCGGFEGNTSFTAAPNSASEAVTAAWPSSSWWISTSTEALTRLEYTAFSRSTFACRAALSSSGLFGEGSCSTFKREAQRSTRARVNRRWPSALAASSHGPLFSRRSSSRKAYDNKRISNFKSIQVATGDLFKLVT